ncbi:putative G-protein coupled receptor 139 [Mustelus asterias]
MEHQNDQKELLESHGDRYGNELRNTKIIVNEIVVKNAVAIEQNPYRFDAVKLAQVQRVKLMVAQSEILIATEISGTLFAMGSDNKEENLLLNLMTIVILSRSKCDLSSCTTRYLVAMATADLLLIFIEVILRRFRYYYYPLCFLDITPVCTVVYILYHTAIDCSVWFTIIFSFDRFVSICCQKLKTKYCTKNMAAVVLASSCVLLFIKNLPFYFRFEPRNIIDNVPWSCNNKPSYSSDPAWIGYKWIDMILTPLLPFVLILFINSLTVRYILMASSVRKRLRGQNKGRNCSDPEMESRRKSVILLFSISGSFILLWLVNVLQRLQIENLFNKDAFYIFEQVGYLLRNLSCCTNTFIYVATQSKFRVHCKKAIKYPIISIIQLFNKWDK